MSPFAFIVTGGMTGNIKSMWDYNAVPNTAMYPDWIAMDIMTWASNHILHTP